MLFVVNCCIIVVLFVVNNCFLWILPRVPILAVAQQVYGHVRKRVKCGSRVQSGAKEDLMRAFQQHVNQERASYPASQKTGGKALGWLAGYPKLSSVVLVLNRNTFTRQHGFCRMATCQLKPFVQNWMQSVNAGSCSNSNF